MPDDFQWLRPAWLLAAPLLVLLAVLLARGRLALGNWQKVVDPALLPFVLERTAGGGSDGRWWLFGCGAVIASLALAGPAWQRIEQPVFRADQALVIALDLSRSMDAADIEPSRLARAKLKILDILKARESGQTALVVYSANAFTVTPLTTDTDTIAALVNSLGTDIMPSRGSYPEVAVDKGQQLLEQAGAAFGEILLITDGGSSPSANERAAALRATGYALSVLGVGTTDGAPIPRRSGGFVTDNRGRIAVPRLEVSGLKALAAAGGGRYATLTAGDNDIEQLLSGRAYSAGAASDGALATDRWREEGPWLILLLLPLAAYAFRRGWVFVALIFIAPMPQTAHATSWDDLWLNKNQQAMDAFEDGDHVTAADLFEDPEWQAAARFYAESYADSAALFGANQSVRSRYNLGNALAMQGKLDAAIEAYEAVLEVEPDHEDARYNLELVKSLKEQQEAEQQGDSGDQQSSDGSDGQGEQSDGSDSEPQDGNDGEQQAGDASDNADSERNAEEMSEDDMRALQEELQRAAEQAEENQQQQMSEAELQALREQRESEQAMEQWLRRIPDDPGGLLRRKFRYQYQRSGKDQDGNDVWPDNEVQPW